MEDDSGLESDGGDRSRLRRTPGLPQSSTRDESKHLGCYQKPQQTAVKEPGLHIDRPSLQVNNIYNFIEIASSVASSSEYTKSHTLEIAGKYSEIAGG